MTVVLFPGAFTPLTKTGNTVVDGILASCYASTDHDSAHFFIKTIQLFPGMLEWIFAKEIGSSNDLYISISEAFNQWILPYSHPY